MAPSKKHHDLLSKSEIAKALGMTSQTFSNRQSRDDKFPPPTYSNRSGSVALYAPEDAKKVYEYCTRAERERLENAAKMFATLTSGDAPAAFEDVELPAPAEEAPKAEAPAKVEEKVEAKPEPKVEEAAPAKVEEKATETDAEKAAKAKATADKIKAADEKIAAGKQAAAAPKAAPVAAPKTAPAKAQAAPTKAAAPTTKGTGAAFGVPQK